MRVVHHTRDLSVRHRQLFTKAQYVKEHSKSRRSIHAKFYYCCYVGLWDNVTPSQGELATQQLKILNSGVTEAQSLLQCIPQPKSVHKNQLAFFA
jgi:hypothetical protein